MDLSYTQMIIVVIISTSMLVGTMANKDWQNYNWQQNYTYSPVVQKNYTNTPKKIIVGGSQGWTFGFNYMDWAFRNGPFYVNDTLVFKYDSPSENNTHPHSVYLLPNMRSFMNCDLSKARMVANVSDGAGDEGFEFVLEKPWRPYFFACGASKGFHCNNGNMKFFVTPIRHWGY